VGTSPARVGSTILLQRLLQSLPAAREQPSVGPCTVCRASGNSSFEGLVDADRANQRHTDFFVRVFVLDYYLNEVSSRQPPSR
jgi:hypothetical protein